MKITILGCGPSYGVPSLYKGWGDCNFQNPKNERLRSAILIEHKGKNILIDTPPEIRLELLRANIKKIDALLYTHSHYDHMAGAEDVRKFMQKRNQLLDIYGVRYDLNVFKNQMKFVFDDPESVASVKLNLIKMHIPFTVHGVLVLPIKQYHGKGLSVGYRIGDLAYSTDVKSMDKKGWEILKGTKVWVLGCNNDYLNQKHLCLDEVLEWVQKIQPKRVYLTHLGAKMDYESLCKKLPLNIRPAYDGLQIDINN